MDENNNSERSRKKEVQRWINCDLNIPHIGVLFGIISSLLYSLNVIFAKMVTLPPLQIALFRFYLQYIILLPIILRADTRRVDYIVGEKDIRVFLWMRGFSGSLSGTFIYLSLQHLSAGNTVTLTFLDVIIVPILARLLCQEALTIFDAILSLIAFVGVVLVAKPTFIFSYLSSEKSESTIGVIYAILSAICAGFSYIALRRMGKGVHYVHSMFYFTMVGAIVNTVLVAITGEFEFPCISDVIIVSLMASCALLGLVTVTLAVQHERGGTVAVLLTLQIIFVYTIQVLFLHDIPSHLSLVGSCMIFSTSICIGIRKIYNERRRRQSVVKGNE